jgi:hypothetical protein
VGRPAHTDEGQDARSRRRAHRRRSSGQGRLPRARLGAYLLRPAVQPAGGRRRERRRRGPGGAPTAGGVEGLAFAHSACHERARLTLLLPYSCSFAHSASTTRTVSVSSLGLRRGFDLAGVGAYGRRMATASLYSSARRPRSAAALAALIHDLVPFYLPASFLLFTDFLPLCTSLAKAAPPVCRCGRTAPR